MEIDFDLALRPISPSLRSLERHFQVSSKGPPAPMRNYHRETPVSDATKRQATPAAVLVPIVDRGPQGPSLLFTRRHHEISYPGHVCFPGGRSEPHDEDASATALRETHEEIGLDRTKVRTLGRLGDYYTQTGWRITPIVGVVESPLELQLDPREVVEAIEIPIGYATRPESYRLWQPEADSDDAYFSLSYGETMITGPTLCLLLGFFEALSTTHAPERS
jgi:8-oxo-dGTP pyrophosphatase MutT (NUDIX family)